MLYTLPHNGRLRRLALGMPVDWFEWAGDNDHASELDLVFWLHGETDAADTFLNDAVGVEALLRGTPLRLPEGMPWLASNAVPDPVDPTQTNLVTRSKAIHVAPQAIGFGAPLTDYAPWAADVAQRAGEDTGTWANIAGLASSILPDDDVGFLGMLRQRVEQRLLDMLFHKRGRRLDKLFRRSLLAGHGAGGVQVYKVMSERPGLFDAYAVVGGSAGGVLRNGLFLPDKVVTYGKAPDAPSPPLLVIHHASDDTFDFLGDQVHALHGRWTTDCSTEAESDLGFYPMSVLDSVTQWAQSPPASIPGGFSEPDPSTPLTCYVETRVVAGLTAGQWPSRIERGTDPALATPTDWTFDGASLVWSWFRDHT